MPCPPDELSQIEVDRLCEAATSVFFAVACFESIRLQCPIALPELLCPTREPPCPCTYHPDLVHEAEQFLVRLGVIYFDEHYRPRLSRT